MQSQQVPKNDGSQMMRSIRSGGSGDVHVCGENISPLPHQTMMALGGLRAVSARRMVHSRAFVTHRPFLRPRGPRMKERKNRLEQQATLVAANKKMTATKRQGAKEAIRAPQTSSGGPKFDPADSATAITPESDTSASAANGRWMDRARAMVDNVANPQYWIPLRYRWPVAMPFRHEHGYALAQRLPWFLVLMGLLSYDETAPFQFIHIQGPSMLPTMAADGSDVWFTVKPWSWARNSWRRGDIVGFAHPTDQQQQQSARRVSCKRIIGLPGDRVYRYGQYVHLFTQQDPTHWGIAPIPRDGQQGSYSWVRDDWLDDDLEGIATGTSAGQDPTMEHRQRDRNAQLVVPEGHVWLEADCPGFGIDSRHFGPVPTEWICGKVIARVWPLGPLRHKVRPHPIPLDEETLKEHNVFRVKR
jgi:signal peptidase I